MKNERYIRQICLPEVGEAGQHTLLKSSVLCVGAGGLGCPALLYLAAAGVGHIGIVDDDSVDLSNLQRQVLFTEDDIGKNKAQAAQARLSQLNSDITIQAYPYRLTRQNAEDVVQKYDIILDGSDNFNTKYLINALALKLRKPWVYGAIQGFEGQVALLNGNTCYECLYPKPPEQPIANCAENGVIGAMAGVIGNIQAWQVIQWLLTNKTSLQQTLWRLDLQDMSTTQHRISKRSGCICHLPQERIELPEAQEQTCLAPLTEDLLVDIRRTEERSLGHIPNDMHISLDELAQALEDGLLPSERKLVFYCQKGIRSLTAVQIAKDKGYNAISLRGGYEVWKSKR